MDRREDLLEAFIDKVKKVEKELAELEGLSYLIPESYNTDSFPDQKELCKNKLENLIIAITHETATQIAFCRNDIQTLVKYIEFREKYNKFTNEELMNIVDGNLSIKFKQTLSNRFISIEEMLSQINLLKQDWNKSFNNATYTKIQKQLHL